MKKKSLLLTAVATLGLTAATMAQNVPSYVPTNGLVGWWPFNGNANDESGNGNNGTVNGASLSSDRFGNTNKAYSFDGLTNWINVSNNSSLNPTNAISISAWVNTNALHNNAGIVGKWNNGLTNAEQYVLQANGQGINFYTKTNVQIGVNEGTILYNNGSWHNYVGTWNGNIMKIYRDGILIDSSTQNGNIPIQLQDLEFGRYAGGQSAVPSNNNYFTGQIDDIGIWNRALTSQEISDLYNGNICYQTITVTDTLLINMSITGFNPVTYNNTIKIFPNPTNDHITINYGNFASLNGYELKIENSLGQQVFQTNINQQSDYLSLTNWGGNGLYFVRIIDQQGNTIDIRKIVLQ